MSSTNQAAWEESLKWKKALKRSPSNKGISHIGRDGVYREFSSKGEVTDYKQLSPEDIKIELDCFKKYLDEERFGRFEEDMRDVDGRRVTDEQQLLFPGPEVVDRKIFERKEGDGVRGHDNTRRTSPEPVTA